MSYIVIRPHGFLVIKLKKYLVNILSDTNDRVFIGMKVDHKSISNIVVALDIRIYISQFVSVADCISGYILISATPNEEIESRSVCYMKG